MAAIRQLKVRYYALYSTGVNWGISVTAMTGDRSAIRISALGQKRSFKVERCCGATVAPYLSLLGNVRFAPIADIQPKRIEYDEDKEGFEAKLKKITKVSPQARSK